jgi:outer membrane protein assembly factor BamD (BamD/ComL family)
VAASLKKVENGLFNMGTIYKNELHDNEKAVEAYKELIRRFPASVYLPTAYYNLYSMAKDQNNMALEEHYKNIIAAQFPQTMYAKVLTNPDYVSELEKENHKVQDYYQTTYDLYKAENYSEVVSRSLYALSNFTGNTLIPRFAYIGTLAAGKSLDKKAFRENLLAFIAKYPHTDEATDAQNLVSYMDKSHPEIKAEQDKIASKERYAPHFDQEHLYGIIVKQKIDINQLVFNIINFNLDRFDSLNLQVNIADLKSGEKCITVKPFSDRDIVMNYFHAIEKTDAVFKDIPKTSIIPIAISSENFTLFKNDNSSDLYLEFFKENYH